MQFAWQAECERVCWNPEQRQSFLEHEVPLGIPVQFFDEFTYRHWFQQTDGFAFVGGDVHIADFVYGHEHRCKRAVHHQANEEGAHKFQSRKIALHGFRYALEAGGLFHKSRNTHFEDAHGQGNPHAQQSPHQKLWKESERFRTILARADAGTDHFAEGGQDTEFQKRHPQRIVLRQHTKTIIYRSADKERQQHYNHNGYH